jgi:hypothetical protein
VAQDLFSTQNWLFLHPRIWMIYSGPPLTSKMLPRRKAFQKNGLKLKPKPISFAKA